MTPSIHVARQWSKSAARREIVRIAQSHGIAAYAVGGAVRDALLGREPHDWDVVAAHAGRLAQQVAADLHATLVRLHADPATYRVVFGARNRQAPREEVDFCALRGRTLVEDLRARDFTVNSLAWRLGDDTGGLVDPCGGRADITARLVRANSARGLAEDPLRCLRAFRLASELGMEVERKTLAWIAQSAAGLSAVAGERVAAELLALAAVPGFPRWLEQMDAHGVLSAILPELSALKGVGRGGYHHLDVWGHTLLLLTELEEMLEHPEKRFPASAQVLRDYAAQPGVAARLKLAALLHDVAKPRTQDIVDGRVRFLGHESVGEDMAREIARRLRLSRDTEAVVARLIRLHMRPIMLVSATAPAEPTPSAVRRLMLDSAPDGPGLLLIAAADLLACRGPATNEQEQRRRVAVLDRMLSRHMEWTRGQGAEPLVRGRDLISELHLEPGPQFSHILQAIARAHADGEITTREEALQLARRIADAASRADTTE